MDALGHVDRTLIIQVLDAVDLVVGNGRCWRACKEGGRKGQEATLNPVLFVCFHAVPGSFSQYFLSTVEQ